MIRNGSFQHAPVLDLTLPRGASGGMLSATYYRELYNRYRVSGKGNIYSSAYTNNITQDLFCKYEANTMHFMGRFVSEYDPPAQVALVAASILNYYSYFWSHKPNNYEII